MTGNFDPTLIDDDHAVSLPEPVGMIHQKSLDTSRADHRKWCLTPPNSENRTNLATSNTKVSRPNRCDAPCRLLGRLSGYKGLFALEIGIYF